MLNMVLIIFDYYIFKLVDLVSRLLNGSSRAAFGGLEQTCYGSTPFSLSQRRKRRILFSQVGISMSSYLI